MESFEKLILQFQNYFDLLIEKAPSILVALVVVFILHFLFKAIRTKLVKYTRSKAEDNLLIDFANSIFRFISITILFLLFMSMIGFGNVAGTILGAAGISAFVIGFALKDIGENFLAGIIMAFDRPFRMGDTIETLDIEGVIINLSLRDTHVKTFDGKDVFIPNGQIIKNPLYNFTMDGFIRHSFLIGIDYNSNIEQARKIILESLLNTPGIITKEKPPRTHVKNLNTSTIDVECHFWIDTFDEKYSSLELKSLAQSKVITTLSQAGVSMPADIVELKNYDNELRFKN